MKFSNTIKTVLKIYQKYVKNSVWFGTGVHVCIVYHRICPDFRSQSILKENQKNTRPFGTVECAKRKAWKKSYFV